MSAVERITNKQKEDEKKLIADKPQKNEKHISSKGIGDKQNED